MVYKCIFWIRVNPASNYLIFGHFFVYFTNKNKTNKNQESEIRDFLFVCVFIISKNITETSHFKFNCITI